MKLKKCCSTSLQSQPNNSERVLLQNLKSCLQYALNNANIIDNLSEVEQLEMELEENNQRKEFTEAELMEGYKRLERLRNPSFFYKIFLFFKKIFEKIINFFARKK